MRRALVWRVSELSAMRRNSLSSFCVRIIPGLLARRFPLVPDRGPRDSQCPEVVEKLPGVNGLMICGPQQKITRGSHVAHIRAIDLDRSEVVRRESREKFQVLLMKGHREVQLVTHTRVRPAAKR